MAPFQGILPVASFVSQQTAGQKPESVRQLFAIFCDEHAQLRDQFIASEVVLLPRKSLANLPDRFWSVHSSPLRVSNFSETCGSLLSGEWRILTVSPPYRGLTETALQDSIKNKSASHSPAVRINEFKINKFYDAIIFAPCGRAPPRW
jgi:hypothetical protein